MTRSYATRNHAQMTESGELIRDYRLNQKPKMPQETLAAKVGITKASLSRVESGKLSLSIALARKLADATGIPFRKLRPDLAEMVDAPPTQPEGAAS